jgi:hypothetical protein
MWKQLHEGDCIVVSRVDRAFRSIHDMARTMKHLMNSGVHLITGCGVNTLTETGRQAIEILSLMAEWESRINSRKVKLAIQYMQETMGPWRCRAEVPRFMKVVETGDTWTAVPDMRWVEQYEEVCLLLDSGMTRRQVSDHMEEMAATRENRPMVPFTSFQLAPFMRKARRENSPERVKNLKRWASKRQLDRHGCYTRDWNELRVRNARRDSIGIIREIMEAE